MEKPDFTTHIINTPELFERLVSYQEQVDSPYLVLDVESDSVSEKTAKLWGIGFCWNDKRAFYVPWRDKDGNAIWDDRTSDSIISWLRSISSQYKIIGHNIIYDVLIIENNLGIDLTPHIYSDTILQKHTLDEEMPFGLKEVAVNILGEWANKAQENLYENIEKNGGTTTKDNVQMWKADTEILAEYCCWDVLLTMILFHIFEKKLQEEELMKLFYEDEIMPLYKTVTIEMKRKGFPVDVDYFNKLKADLRKEIDQLEDDIIKEISPDIDNFVENLLKEEVPVKPKGNFPKVLAEEMKIPLPKNKDGKITLSKKELEKFKTIFNQYEEFYDWISGTSTMPSSVSKGSGSIWEKAFSGNILEKVQKKIYLEGQDRRYIFNLNSNDHLGHLVFEQWGFSPKERTPTGKPKIDDDYLESIKDTAPVLGKLLDFKKLNKLLSTYVEGILDRQIDGIIYTSMLQFGTTSGRFSSRNPNLQNQPRVKDEDSGLSPLVLKYVNAIKVGFIAGKGRKVVNADYSSLEPVCFAHMSGDEGLRNIFRYGEDLYSRIAIDVFKLKGVSAKKKDANYLKNVHPEFRQKSKIFCLAVPYGAEESRISDEMKVSYSEAKSIINAYLNAYPELRKYMYRCNYEAKTKGFVKTEFGRIRHLKAAKSIYTLYTDDILDYKWANQRNLKDIRREYKNYLNNAKNFKIQGLAAHIVNRAMIATVKAFKENNIDGWVALQVHDEITCIVREDQAELASKILRDCMENTTKISVPLQAEPLIADNWAEAK